MTSWHGMTSTTTTNGRDQGCFFGLRIPEATAILALPENRLACTQFSKNFYLYAAVEALCFCLVRRDFCPCRLPSRAKYISFALQEH